MEKRKKQGCILSFYNCYFLYIVCLKKKKKKLLEANGTFSANVIKNPARYVSCIDIIYIIIYINNFSLLAMPRLWLIFICLSFPLLSGPDAVGMPM